MFSEVMVNLLFR